MIATIGLSLAPGVFELGYKLNRSAVEGWEELDKQLEDGAKFNIDSVAARVHAGWAQATHNVFFVD